MTAHDRLNARIAESDRLEEGQRAEGHGLRAAFAFPVPYNYSRHNPYLQQRFEQGFREGKTILEVHHAPADCPANGTEASADRLRTGLSDDGAVRREATTQPSPYSAT